MNKKKTLRISCAVYSAVNLILILMLHIPENIIRKSSIGYDYFRFFFTDLFELLMPLAGAAVLFALLPKERPAAVFKASLYFSLPRIIHLLPYYYLYATANGNDWQESLCISFLITALGVAINLGATFGFSMLMRLIAVRALVSENSDTLPKSAAQNKENQIELTKKAFEKLPERTYEKGIFDLSAPATLAVFVSALLAFVYSLGYEIYSIVIYLVEWGSFLKSDLIYTVCRLLFVFVMLFVSHISCYFIKNLVGGVNCDGEDSALG